MHSSRPNAQQEIDIEKRQFIWNSQHRSWAAKSNDLWFFCPEKKENPKKNELSNAFNVFAILYCTEKKAILFLLYSLSLALRSCCSRLLTSFKSHTQQSPKSLNVSRAMSYFYEIEFKIWAKLYIPSTINIWKKVLTKAIWADKKWAEILNKIGI